MQGAYQAYPAPGGSPPAGRSRRSRALIITLSVAGAFMLVAASLVVGLILTSDRSDETAGTNPQQAVTGEEADPADDTAAVQTQEQPAPADDEPAAVASDQVSGQGPANLLGDLYLFNLSGTSVEQQTVQADTGVVGEVADPAAARQSFVDQLAELGVTEAEVADFLAAYDLLVSEEFMSAYAALTAEEQQAYELALLGAIESYLAAFFADCDLSDVFSGTGTEADVQADLTACVVTSINQLGSDIVRISQEHGLAPATGSEEQTS